MRRDFNYVLSHTAYHLRDVWNNYSPLLCSQYIVVSILCADILDTGVSRHPLVEPYRAPREDSESQWGDDAKAIDSGLGALN
jgi:hypothetical protein